MTTESNLKSKIRKLLILAADSRGNKAQRKEASRLAKKLLKRHGWTEADLNDGISEMPNETTVFVRVLNAFNKDRMMVVCCLLKRQFPRVKIGYNAAIQNGERWHVRFTGEDPKPAAELWKKLDDLVAAHVYTEMTTIDALKAGIGRLMPYLVAGAMHDDYSYCGGVYEGFVKASVIAKHKEEQNGSIDIQDNLQVGGKTVLEIQQPKPGRVRKVVALLNAPTVEPQPERKIIPVRRGPVVHKESAEPRPEPEDTPRPIEMGSFHRGFKFGQSIVFSAVKNFKQKE